MGMASLVTPLGSEGRELDGVRLVYGILPRAVHYEEQKGAGVGQGLEKEISLVARVQLCTHRVAPAADGTHHLREVVHPVREKVDPEGVQVDVGGEIDDSHEQGAEARSHAEHHEYADAEERRPEAAVRRPRDPSSNGEDGVDPVAQEAVRARPPTVEKEAHQEHAPGESQALGAALHAVHLRCLERIDEAPTLSDCQAQVREENEQATHDGQRLRNELEIPQLAIHERMPYAPEQQHDTANARPGVADDGERAEQLHEKAHENEGCDCPGAETDDLERDALRLPLEEHARGVLEKCAHREGTGDEFRLP
eukprot:CAMPEP_0206047336 /NCGR_PEP_ID=MMETSP1466-20131121/20952_1 /ASSEMBLY_ACC=CAM_ASM_001126 /TAXON_ID=44452 /ORGANISM="Pavlova gyrans, Strain CCMP608" /LENGTH=309 /DNA_ID=CAMNT_0053422347 /DNA_START=175 /DNA_END=1100 /DNA_ORIENTATION=+